ncbi:hypothetical protein ABE26_02320 [Cytobacillus firmus]|nr:hypothetical protein [Cytobacillus firmus]
MRTRVNFGHRKQKNVGQSQNPVELRTQKGGKPGSESEPGRASDTERRKTWIRVRTRSSFGHRKEENLDLSPNPSQLRTQTAEKRRSESEPGRASDTERRKTWIRVRTRVNFGHRKEETLDLSQNPSQLRTQTAGKRRSESEHGPASERIVRLLVLSNG